MAITTASLGASKQEPESDPIALHIIATLEKAKRVMKSGELAGGTKFTSDQIRRAADKLCDSGLLAKHQRSGANLYHLIKHALLPEFGIDAEMLALDALLDEKAILKIADDRLDRDFLARDQEALDSVELVHVPLWRVHFSESWEKLKLLGFIGGGEKTVIDSVYLHAAKLTFAYFNDIEGFEFLKDPFSKRASEIGDLDNQDLPEFKLIAPLKLSLNRALLKKIQPASEAEAALKSRYKIKPTQSELVFIPMYRVKYRPLKEGRARTLKLDGIFGFEMLY